MPAKKAEDQVELKCPKCEGAMEQGYLVDHGHANVKRQEQWVAGEPKNSWFIGLDTSGRKVRRVVTCRCIVCGFLESYAH